MSYELVCLTVTLCTVRGFHAYTCFVKVDKPIKPWLTARNLNGQAVPRRTDRTGR